MSAASLKRVHGLKLFAWSFNEELTSEHPSLATAETRGEKVFIEGRVAGGLFVQAEGRAALQPHRRHERPSPESRDASGPSKVRALSFGLSRCDVPGGLALFAFFVWKRVNRRALAEDASQTAEVRRSEAVS